MYSNLSLYLCFIQYFLINLSFVFLFYCFLLNWPNWKSVGYFVRFHYYLIYCFSYLNLKNLKFCYFFFAFRHHKLRNLFPNYLMVILHYPKRIFYNCNIKRSEYFIHKGTFLICHTTSKINLLALLAIYCNFKWFYLYCTYPLYK